MSGINHFEKTLRKGFTGQVIEGLSFHNYKISPELIKNFGAARVLSYIHEQEQICQKEFNIQIRIQKEAIIPEDCRHFSEGLSDFLFGLYLSGNKIQEEGCKKIGAKNWPKLRALFLDECQIDSHCLAHLSKAEFNMIQSIFLHKNQIGEDGCRHLAHTRSLTLENLKLNYNSIGDIGCGYLRESNWEHLKVLFLKNNNIGDLGCEYLTEIPWTHLKQIGLENNKIKDRGCKSISKAQWNQLVIMNLQHNSIGEKGCRYLSKYHPKMLLQIQLGQNRVRDRGCKYLSYAGWDNLEVLLLCDIFNHSFSKTTNYFDDLNRIMYKGCEQLVKMKSRNKKKLCLIVKPQDKPGLLYLKARKWRTITYKDIHQGENF